MQVTSPKEAAQHEEYLAALKELLFQLADDDFILAYRGSEWLGLAPHIEEDVAYSSINQNTMGHAAMYYLLLEELGEGDADALAHGREAAERRNAIILEEVNGTGHYLKEPRYDWAFAVVRHFFYDLAKKVRLESLKNSSYEPLAQTALKINIEQYYHIMHWKTWFIQLAGSEGEAARRMKEAVEKVWKDFGGVLTLGPQAEKMAEFGLIESEENLKMRWLHAVSDVLEKTGIALPGEPGIARGDGRSGIHTADLDAALSQLNEVYASGPALSW
ncbi:1,2-phenylacetyl-CoA epoxidase subunit PaaC [Bacillus marinisedimentorum]|uniref:1,2-phenylacetyl-CoA epoxidase subunit PaaC n=1 Tax=Bacillus marinisedimentorum TaxID=1821260 RepID=UPI000871C341|nr:1,2-phenylacetyl-CoA epoxidase subunit PaaC [Bacillus marinisedimentorum]